MCRLLRAKRSMRVTVTSLRNKPSIMPRCSRRFVSPLDSEPAKLELAIGVVVEEALGDIYDGLTPEGDDASRSPSNLHRWVNHQ